MRVLGLIPARGGSKGIPGKNIRRLAGTPLLAYTAEAALAASSLTRVVLSTDSAQIAAVGRAWGVDVPFIRPAALAQDTTPTLPVVQHAVAWLEAQGEHYDAICLLQPTAPLRQATDIDACVTLLQQHSADAVISVLAVPPAFHPSWVYVQQPDGSLTLATGATCPPPRRQELPPAFHREGSVYVTRRDVVVCQHSLYGQRVVGYLMASEHSVNIDTPADWLRAEQLLAREIT